MTDVHAVERAMRACRHTAAQLTAARIPRETLATFVPAGRRLLVLPRAATMSPVGDVWRLGTLLLSADGELWAAGKFTRSAERGRVGYQSVSREERKDLAAAALHGGYPIGTPVNFDATPLMRDGVLVPGATADSPIGLEGDEVRVRWRVGAPLEGAPTLADYLAERVELLLDPPAT